MADTDGVIEISRTITAHLKVSPSFRRLFTQYLNPVATDDYRLSIPIDTKTIHLLFFYNL